MDVILEDDAACQEEILHGPSNSVNMDDTPANHRDRVNGFGGRDSPTFPANCANGSDSRNNPVYPCDVGESVEYRHLHVNFFEYDVIYIDKKEYQYNWRMSTDANTVTSDDALEMIDADISNVNSHRSHACNDTPIETNEDPYMELHEFSGHEDPVLMRGGFKSNSSSGATSRNANSSEQFVKSRESNTTQRPSMEWSQNNIIEYDDVYMNLTATPFSYASTPTLIYPELGIEGKNWKPTKEEIAHLHRLKCDSNNCNVKCVEYIFDCETTGLDVNLGHRIIQLSVRKMVDGRPLGDHFSSHINPGRAVDHGSFLVHGKSTSICAKYPYTFKDITADFLRFIRDGRLVCHNSKFDMGFLNRELYYAGYDQIEPSRVLCTLEMARYLCPNEPCNLDYLARKFGVLTSPRAIHNAEENVWMLCYVYANLFLLNMAKQRQLYGWE